MIVHTKQSEAIYTYVVEKYQKRLWLKILETGERVYTPPDFVRQYMTSRESMQKLAESLCYGTHNPQFIKAIVAFESAIVNSKYLTKVTK